MTVADRQPSPRALVILAASRRGISTPMIAVALGISSQAVSQTLRKFGAATKVARYRFHDLNGPQHPKQCPVCKKTSWVPQWRKDDVWFCSVACSHSPWKVLSDNGVRSAIDQRIAGTTWRIIAKRSGVSAQTVQTRIWRYLHNSGQLNATVVEPIWRRTTSEHRREASWAWLENNTGLKLRATARTRFHASDAEVASEARVY